MDGITRRLTFVEYSLHLFGNWHLDATGVGKPNGGMGGEDSFGDHTMHPGDYLRQLAATPQFNAHTAVARESSSTGKNEITKSCQACHGLLAPTAGYHEASHFSQTASDQTGDRIVTKLQAIT